MNVHQSKSLEKSEIQAAESDIPEPNLLEVELAVERFKKINHKAPGVDQILFEIIQADEVNYIYAKAKRSKKENALVLQVLS